MLTIGLTGGIAAGKSAVAALFAQHGATIIDADVLARQAIQPGSAAFTSVSQHFGPSILTPEGSLDRKKLRAIIFNHPEERKWLENLLHPEIIEIMTQQINLCETPYCICIIPLLFESGPFPFIQRILVIDAPEQQQVNRVMARDHISELDAKAIIQAQSERQSRIEQADDVITNTGTLADLTEQVDKLHALYIKLSSAPSPEGI
ncbi:MAG TPA: dephospho-CoA kinase [Gammaproteobacteria bacterium]|jgi:dephospho-CoA kinase|nr:dephospho-CoA kinase [Gammaproteobacteria bacterium]